MAGSLEVRTGVRLPLENSPSARDLTLAGVGTLIGPGNVRTEGANRVVPQSDFTWSIGLLDMPGSSSIAGPFTLTIDAGSTLQFDHSSTIPGSVTVKGTLALTSASVTLTLNATGFLNNPGTIQVGAFVNNAPPDHLIGNPPPICRVGGMSSGRSPR